MRILSQSGEVDLPYESVGISRDSTEIVAVPISDSNPQDRYWVFAEYSTEEKAKKAMDMLHAKYREMAIYPFSDKSSTIPPKTFQFPADSEVEV